MQDSRDVLGFRIFGHVNLEHMEAVTDAHLNAWYDSSGNEIGDKCAWNFGPLSLDGGKANEEWNGHYYLVQQEGSNSKAGCTQG